MPEQLTFDEWMAWLGRIERMMGDSADEFQRVFRGTVVNYQPMREIETVETGDYL